MLRATLTSLAALALLGSPAWGQGHAGGGHAGGGHAGGAQSLGAVATLPGVNFGSGGAVVTSNGLGAVSGGFAYNPAYGMNGMFGGYGANPWAGAYGGYGGFGATGYGMGGGYPYAGYNTGFGVGNNQNLPLSNGGTVGATRGSDNVAAMMNGAIPAAPKGNGAATKTKAKPTKRKKR